MLEKKIQFSLRPGLPHCSQKLDKLSKSEKGSPEKIIVLFLIDIISVEKSTVRH